MPHPDRRPKVHEIHGHRRIDEHHWLSNPDDPSVLAWLREENRRADAALAAGHSDHDALKREMRERIVPDETSVPYREGSYNYYVRFRPSAEYPLYCRTPLPDGPEQVLLDCQALASGHDYFSCSGLAVARDERHAAFAIDTTGDGVFAIHFIDLDTGRIDDACIGGAAGDFEWAADSRSLLYTRQHPETHRYFQVRCYDRCTADDRLVYQEDDDACWVGVEQSLTGRHLFICSDATLSTEVFVIPAARPDAKPRCFLGRQDGHEYYVTDGEDRFYVLSNLDAPNFGLWECPLDDTRPAAWREVVPHRDDVLVHSVEVLADYLVLSVSANGLDHIEIVSRSDGSRRRIDFDASVYTASPMDNYVYRASTLRYGFESPTMPARTIDHDLASGAEQLVREQPVAGGFESGDYVAERRWLTARDGTSVPVSLVWRTTTAHGEDTPLLVEAYGAYGAGSEPQFDSDLFCLLDRGFVYALAHVRGGSELGRHWYHAGRRHMKMNTFLDFIDVTRGLHAAGLSSPAHTYGTGGSAGGLLIGAVANMAPGLFNGLAAGVPFVDVVTTMLDESLPLTTGEYDEWGDPRERRDYFYMLGYSPYDNVREQPYPHLLVTASLHDAQVRYWQAAKWVARLRERRTNEGLLLLKTDLDAGHDGKSGRYRSLDDTALEYGFFLMLEARAGDD